MRLEEGVVGVGARAAVALFIQVQRSTIDTLSFLDLLLLLSAEQLLHWILQVQGVAVAADV